MNQSVQRAADLFSHLFGDSDSMLIVFQRFTRTRREKLRVPKKYLGEAIVGLEDLVIRKNGSLEKRRYCSYKASDLQHRLIFDDVANYRGHLAFYFFDLSRKIMMHMYDDRGCDIVSTNLDCLAPLYNDFNEWLLDYDRDRMDGVFLREPAEADRALTSVKV